MNIYDLINKQINLKNYSNLIELYGKVFNSIIDSHKDVYDDYHIEKQLSYIQNEDLIYGSPFLNSVRKTFLKKSKKSRVKTFKKVDSKILDVKKEDYNILSFVNSCDLYYTQNQALAIEIDRIVSLIQSIDNIKHMTELEPLIKDIELQLDSFVKEFEIKTKYVIYIENFKSKHVDSFKNLFKDYKFKIDDYENDYWIEIEIENSFDFIVDFLNNNDFEFKKYDFDEDSFKIKYLSRTLLLDIKSFYDINS